MNRAGSFEVIKDIVNKASVVCKTGSQSEFEGSSLLYIYRTIKCYTRISSMLLTAYMYEITPQCNWLLITEISHTYSSGNKQRFVTSPTNKIHLLSHYMLMKQRIIETALVLLFIVLEFIFLGCFPYNQIKNTHTSK